MSNVKTNGNAQAQTQTQAQAQVTGKLIQFLAKTANITEGEVVLLGLWMYQHKNELLSKVAEITHKNLTTEEEILFLLQGAPITLDVKNLMVNIEASFHELLEKMLKLVDVQIGEALGASLRVHIAKELTGVKKSDLKVWASSKLDELKNKFDGDAADQDTQNDGRLVGMLSFGESIPPFLKV